MVSIKKSLLVVALGIGLISPAASYSSPLKYNILLNIELEMLPSVLVPQWEVDETEEALTVILHNIEGVNTALFDQELQTLQLLSPRAMCEIGLSEHEEGYMLALYLCQQDFAADDAQEDEVRFVQLEHFELSAPYALEQASVEYDEEEAQLVVVMPAKQSKQVESQALIPVKLASTVKHDEESIKEEVVAESKEVIEEHEKQMLAK